MSSEQLYDVWWTAPSEGEQPMEDSHDRHWQKIVDMIVEEDMVVTISHRGYVKRCSPSLYKAQRRGGKGVLGSKKLNEEDEDFISELFLGDGTADISTGYNVSNGTVFKF